MTIQYTLELPSGGKIQKTLEVPDELDWYDIMATIENDTGCTILVWNFVEE